MITSSSWRSPFSKLWTINEFFDETFEFKEEEYLEFAPASQDKLVFLQNTFLFFVSQFIPKVGTRPEGVATIYDVTTGQQTRLLKPTSSNAYAGTI